MLKVRIILLAVAVAAISAATRADSLTDRLDRLSPDLVRQFSVSLDNWRFFQPDVPGGEQPAFDDSAWHTVTPGFSWHGENTKVWFRAKVTIPATVAGQPVAGAPVRIELGMDDDGELYVDGQLVEAFHWDDGHYTLSEQAQPGRTYDIAVRGINGPGDGQFHFARLSFDVLPQFDQYLNEVKFASLLADRVPPAQRSVLTQAVSASESEIQFAQVTSANLDTVRAQLERAHRDLAPIVAVTRQYDVYYIGHSHIDMNWLWTWPDTIDTCHRTWNSAMRLMAEFPQFHYVQSQPAAYVPIEKTYPAEFASMQAKAASGQWDPVGGLWNESDTDIPSGEGLAMSFLLGQRYFKEHFGKYAVTGWLPDSFGHTWQLPQIMRLAGIRYYYHMRCGNGMPFVWWEAPDGSRVLTANTGSYDDDPQLSQLAEAIQNQSRYDLPESLVVFGVGDHGGGPTGEQIRRIESFRDDPLLPRVHFAGADDFFKQLESLPAAGSLPVVDTGLQYTFEGCYTTHGDMKKAIRTSENNLYSAQVLSSLAAMMGRTYPLDAFRDAWKPTAFAQFHDIACGSAIHSTYDWMHEQLAPAFQFEREETRDSLNFLAACADTRGPGETPIVVWNTLAFARDDVVKVPMPNAAQFHSVVDEQGRLFPAQVMGGTNLVFIAHNVPALGHAVYFPGTSPATPDGLTFQDMDDVCEADTPNFTLDISKRTGAFVRLYLKQAQWNVFRSGDADLLELLGDNGNAWDINYTGKSQVLTTHGANVSIAEQGPVFARVRVHHSLEKSSFDQDIIVYGALPRIDVSTMVDWQEEHQLLKILFPVDADHAEVTAQIPFTSTVFPGTEQECPGQKWMDVSQTVPQAVQDATPLDLSPLFNVRRTENFDGSGHSFAAQLLPAAGRLRLGFSRVPFILPGNNGQPDSISASGQQFALPAADEGDTLYLLAGCVNGGRWTSIGFRLADESVETRAFPLNDWVVGSYPDDAIGLTFPSWQSGGGLENVPPHMWIVRVPLPNTARALVLPRDPDVRIFAATIATAPSPLTPYGLSVLNDCKYGFDETNGLFRLTALRSSSDPDPHPDRGLQEFTYSLFPHADGWQTAHTDEQALGLNIHLLAAVTTVHAPTAHIPDISVTNIGGAGDLIVTALKQSEDGHGFILRFYEADGRDTQAQIAFDEPMHVEQTDILERRLAAQSLTVQGAVATLPVGHNQIVTLHFWSDSKAEIKIRDQSSASGLKINQAVKAENRSTFL
ncbi:MAG TPA: glycoside hydrolase family 38 C-terminal domain-containing protein [Alphaproteobacteria bacterium]|nr:glycoside hydrolase family 38 C-terminal domain-containing protein [Alphaproteobacteria bacterium]